MTPHALACGSLLIEIELFDELLASLGRQAMFQYGYQNNDDTWVNLPGEKTHGGWCRSGRLTSVVQQKLNRIRSWFNGMDSSHYRALAL